jgi:hypothetical protein
LNRIFHYPEALPRGISWLCEISEEVETTSQKYCVRDRLQIEIGAVFTVFGIFECLSEIEEMEFPV